MRVLPVCAVALMVIAAAAAVGGAQAFTPTAVVETSGGPVQGSYCERSGVNSFKGIPYGAPPVKELRFADPQPAATWTAVLNATKYAPGCMSTCPPVGFPKKELMCTPTVSEDCLYLNVFAPSDATKPLVPREGRKLGANGGMPVILFLHGGNFEYGSGGVPLYDGTQLARTQHVVVVTINYRLGVFGALFTGGDGVNGNFMLKDQILAMQWIQANVAAFGGDATRVTITGQSAGAFSVATHLMLPASQGLFSGVIIVSNPASLLAADPVGAMQLGTKVLKGLNCRESGGVLEIACLRNASAESILALAKTDYSFNPDTLLNDMMQWVPVVDGTFVPMQPIDAFARGNISRVPVFFGTVANESVEFIHKLSEGPMSALEFDLFVELVFGSNVSAGIKEVYGPVPESMQSDARPFMELIATDFIFYCVSRNIGRQLTKVTPTYMWLYDYLSYANEWVFGKTMPFCVKEVCHAEDLSSIFFPYQWIPREPGEPYPPPQREMDLSAIVQGAWGDFAYNGDPNPIGGGLPQSAIVPGTHFPRFNESNILVNYSVPTSNLVGYRDSYCDFWDSVGYRKRR